MKVVLVVPHYHQPRGNKVTVERISKGLNALNIHTEIVSSTDETTNEVSLTADLYHGFHAYQFFKFLEKSAATLKPYMLTMTGTDLNHDLYDPERREDVINTLNGAEAVHVFEKKAKEKLVKEVPSLEKKIFVIPQGAADISNNNSIFLKEETTFLFILPAGIREVKNIPQAISMLKAVREKHPYVRLWLVGPVIEESEGDIVLELVKENEEWIKYLGAFPHEQMGAIFNQGDVILNTSLSEGQPAAIIEAMLLEIPVLASDISGNRSLINHEETGFLYNNDKEFFDYAEQLIQEPSVRENLKAAAKTYVSGNHSPEEEAYQFSSIYKKILTGK